MGAGQNRETGSHSPDPDCPGLTSVEILVWVPELIAAEAVGQSSIAIYGLANVRLYVQSHCAEREPSSVIWVTLLISLCLGSLTSSVKGGC